MRDQAIARLCHMILRDVGLAFWFNLVSDGLAVDGVDRGTPPGAEWGEGGRPR